jgi:peptide chain release factor 3
MKTKQLDKGIRQLTEEGVAQVFFPRARQSKNRWYSRVKLQFEVIKYRLENEYGAKCDFETKNVLQSVLDYNR